jgi:amino acid transporter
MTPLPSSVSPLFLHLQTLANFPGVTQTFANTLYGPTGFLIYTIGISLSALGSINSNVFAVGRLAASASRRDYIPRFFADNSIGMSVEKEEEWLRVTMRERWPAWVVCCVTRFARATGRLRLKKGVPV